MSSVQPGETYVVGVDFGTESGRAVVVRAQDGTELASAVCPYPHGVIDRSPGASGRPLPPEWALQDPEDYLTVLRTAVPQALKESGVDPSSVVGIGVDFTSCTVLGELDGVWLLTNDPALFGRVAHLRVQHRQTLGCSTLSTGYSSPTFATVNWEFPLSSF